MNYRKGYINLSDCVCRIVFTYYKNHSFFFFCHLVDYIDNMNVFTQTQADKEPSFRSHKPARITILPEPDKTTRYKRTKG